MGKTEEEQVLDDVPVLPELPRVNAGGRCPHCRSVGMIVHLRCIAALLVGVAVLLSAVFWLPPFIRRGSGVGSSDLDRQYRADVMASFILQEPIYLLRSNVAKLQYDIYDEISVPNAIVTIMYLEPLGINSTNVVFGVLPYPKESNISTGLSILKSSFVSLVLQQSTLHLTTSLFGSSYFFQVLKFPGGITVVPLQHAFLLQKEKLLFNFSLNFPIYQVQDKIDELKEQMRLGLHLKTYEILFVRLSNIDGSTVAPPTIVQTFILLAVGKNQPSVPRLKQLAQNIRNSSAGNLGLNHTVFGRVKQISLSSFLQHSLSSGVGSSLSPSPAPQPSAASHHNHLSHHHHSGHHSNEHLAPAPASTPKPRFAHQAPPPTDCRFSFSRHLKRMPRIVPAAAPLTKHHLSIHPNEAAPSLSPHLHPISHMPAVIFAHASPPSGHVEDIKPPDKAPSISPSPLSCEFSLLELCVSVWFFFCKFLIRYQH
ncbi:hypothetical protein AXF42_Ash009903 [Apostasia shenzhenica]|uniref:DUF7036 domain-containing protein n=1 Tax=Apostasia shenzhenica TaxID=1088818 RepID=A0A2I0AC95_9ASPA|nr:hypothetical protein AXF42_Ash009903 [Apostasia shenzhenica]